MLYTQYNCVAFILKGCWVFFCLYEKYEVFLSFLSVCLSSYDSGKGHPRNQNQKTLLIPGGKLSGFSFPLELRCLSVLSHLAPALKVS